MFLPLLRFVRPGNVVRRALLGVRRLMPILNLNRTKSLAPARTSLNLYYIISLTVVIVRRCRFTH